MTETPLRSSVFASIWRRCGLPLICIVLSLLPFGCSNKYEGNTAVSRSLAKAVEVGALRGEPVDLIESTDFAWERVVVVCPFDEEAVVEERLGFDWDDLPRTDTSEGSAVLAFVRGGEVVDWTKVARRNGDLCREGVPRAFERDAARFNVTVDPDERQEFYILSPA